MVMKYWSYVTLIYIYIYVRNNGRQIGVRVPVGSSMLFPHPGRFWVLILPHTYGYSGSFVEGGVWPWREVRQSPSNAEVKKTQIYTSTQAYAFMV
jgi:hypothetical protein